MPCVPAPPTPPQPSPESPASRTRAPGAAGWPAAPAALGPATDAERARELPAGLTSAAALHCLPNAHGSAVMLVHSATAPKAVLRTLPALPRTQWVESVHAAWAASAAVTAAYRPATPAPADSLPAAPESADRHGDEHVIKLADTCLEVHRRTGRPEALAAVVRAAGLIDEL
ncbi:hypothetical protein [Streptomyces sp. NPDC007905]|uniref:hypothetical protein n=1 Tax=Streptomyces sp. NPDC007905 TaxID=3364788 RepID=UPI0036ED43F6